MAGTISMSGLVSSTDWTKLIDDTINAQKTAAQTPYTDGKNTYQAKLTAWQAFNMTLTSVVDYVKNNSLDDDDGYALYKTSLSSSDVSVTPANVLTASVGSPKGPGNYTVEVTTLAEAEKIASDSFVSRTDALHLTGDILVNNKKVAIADGDSLVEVAGKINNAGAGVVATILAVSATDFKLMIESKTTGAAGMSLKNGSSAEILESLNLHTATTELAHASGLDALSDTYTSKTTVLGTLLGLTASETGTVQIKGTDSNLYGVTINLATDTLEGIVTKINTANGGGAIPGVTASVEQVTVNGATQYELKLTNVDVADFQDDKNILETLGVLTNTVKNSLRSGQDAFLEIDGFGVTSTSNTVTDSIDGVTLNLVGTNTGKPIELAISQDNSRISEKTSDLIGNLNSTLTYIKEQNTYSSDSTTKTQKPLMGDVNLAAVKNTILNALYETVAGNSQYKNASSIGITYGKDNTLSVDTTKLSNALSNNSQETINVLKTLANTLRENLNAYVDPLTGTLTYVKTSIQDAMTRIDKRVAQLDAKFEQQRVLLEKRYNALELLISQSNSTKSWLTQQVNYMTGQNKE